MTRGQTLASPAASIGRRCSNPTRVAKNNYHSASRIKANFLFSTSASTTQAFRACIRHRTLLSPRQEHARQ
ncbi:hypothetical protein PC116_g24941 [Phytophthora cactorum]|uniref:Uncharacterized protein n=1 Tax=Phytophthora cactorum TaxID=29920 RepID=A0A8T1F840_9STRA|nr:hypothetical protein PC112_g20799 [Phytophthora cactorum]KAG2799739.1 hypothetical protein PC111_g20296 [Phytophthora cactorum]KAG2897527.1 hypothetical protein PC117_g22775 [Phytophthora cactorum]KAG2963880.1 hypothetical protein PC118_g20652 [Phytophthora cactorum]KAG2975188.1 hypothetical protein PC119_g22524 [Phytophthora cactorum]